MHRLFQKHLPLDLVSYDLPSGGMFFFLNFVSPLVQSTYLLTLN
jgi:hypothetical protein